MMKKILVSAIMIFAILSAASGLSVSAAAPGSLIQNIQISLKSTETPNRLEVSFQLTEAIDLSKGSSNIIYEYLSKDSSGNLVSMNYKKDKTWSGYLNSYDNYPAGEHKYSSGTENNTAYSDQVPAGTIYTSVKTGAGIDVTDVAAVSVTVLRADGTGEKITVYSDGTTSEVQKIEVPLVIKDKTTGILLESTTAALPSNTVLNAKKITGGPVYDQIKAALANATKFIAFELTLTSGGNTIKPDGKVKISIPIPDNFNTSYLAIYRIDSDGTKTSYPLSVTTKDKVKYATFETDHFSNYALAEESNKMTTPKTGETWTLYAPILTVISLAIGIAAFRKKGKFGWE